MTPIEQIKKPIAEEFKLFDVYFEKEFESNNDILSVVNNYLLDNKGKQCRPLLTFLSARICGLSTPATIDAAVSLELLHTASLIHDDIVDDTYERRGRQSINAIWKNKISVLVGDYLLSKSLSIANRTGNLQIISHITELGKELSEGELLQITNTKDISTKEEKYFEVIRKKTAKLFSTCTVLGAISVNADDTQIDMLRKFGEFYGICFQIRDDVFDYIASEKEIGKPVGNDIREGKITLPLLYALNNTDKNINKEFFDILEKQDFSEKNVQKLIVFAKENGGIEYAEKQMDNLRSKAMETIRPFPESEIKNALISFFDYTVERKK